ncbi:MAG TPA: hypothetical protein VLF95_01520 [Vicinamibacteria bacterium]|nr:hypothetical protein [Vicinamibacteria bacterium]
MRSPRALAPLLLAALLPACGGSGASPSTGTPAPTPVPGSSSNPCSAALAATSGVTASAGTPSPKADGFGEDDRDPRDFLALHLLPRGGGVSSRASSSAAARSGDIAVLSDDGSLVIGANPFDVGGTGFRFEPNGQGGYDVRGASSAFRADLGKRLRLADDDTSEETLAFPFPFYGTVRAAAFVNSDGNLTFGEGDVATTARSLGRLLSGAPRVAPFFADLDPAKGGGVFVAATSDAFTVTWCAVPDFDGTGKVTAQASLLPGGALEIRIDGATTLRDAVVALSPGATGEFTALDLSAAGGSAAGGSGAVGERFAAESSLDLVSASRRFYAEFADDYDQLVFWSDVRVVESGTFAFESTVENAVTGIGQEVAHFASAYGSGGRLSSLVVMDDLGKYPADPAQRANGENSTLALVAHETGHRWGATLKFRDQGGGASDAWLGRQRAHWSFYCDSDASVLEGNDIQDQGGGSFRTVGAVQRYGPFDLYAMGLLAEGDVPPAFFVEAPSGASQDRESAPRTGVAFTGTRHEVSIGDVVAAMGRRDPPASRSPRAHRQAWVYVVSRGRSADRAAIEKLETIRRAFEGFFFDATGGRMSVETRLD